MIDISEKELIIIKTILSKHAPNNEVWAFGSRITGKAKKYSDLDLAIITKTPLPPLAMALLKDDFSESTLPFKVDVLDWSQLSDEFKSIISKQYIILIYAN